MNKLHILFLFVMMIFLGSSCDGKLKYQGDWIIMEAEYNGESILNSIRFRNMSVNFAGGRGFTPIVSYKDFEDKDIAYDVEFSFYRKSGEDYLVIKGSRFFTDTFEVRCLTKPCCRIALENEKKYVKLIFNGELSTFEKRRDCPNTLDTLEE